MPKNSNTTQRNSTDKTVYAGQQVVVRLTAHQAFELSNITSSLNVTKSQFIRYILDKAITKYYENN